MNGPNQYLIQHKIRTVVLLPLSFVFQDFDFSQYDTGNPDSGDWLAKKTLSAADFREAHNAFIQDLIEITDALSVICHCSISILGMSYMVCKLNNNCQVFFAHIAEREASGTTVAFTKKEIGDLQKLMDADCRAALHFLRECNNAETVVTALTMAICAAEALAGTGETSGKCSQCGYEYRYNSTDKTELRNVIGAEYGHLYEKDGGALRHKLFHGSGISQVEAADVLNNVNQGILSYLGNKLSLGGVPYTNTLAQKFYRVREGGYFLKQNNGEMPDLRTVERKWNDPSGFTIIRPEPADY